MTFSGFPPVFSPAATPGTCSCIRAGLCSPPQRSGLLRVPAKHPAFLCFLRFLGSICPSNMSSGSRNQMFTARRLTIAPSGSACQETRKQMVLAGDPWPDRGQRSAKKAPETSRGERLDYRRRGCPSRSDGIGIPASCARVGAASTVLTRSVEIPGSTPGPKKTSGTCLS